MGRWARYSLKAHTAHGDEISSALHPGRRLIPPTDPVQMLRDYRRVIANL